MTRCRLFHKWGPWGEPYLSEKMTYFPGADPVGPYFVRQQDRRCSRCGEEQIKRVTP